MQINLTHRPGNTVAEVNLAVGESISAEAGAMIAMSGNVSITTTTHKKNAGGIFKAAKRMLGGESFFINHFEAREREGKVFLGTALAGDMQCIALNHTGLVVQSGSYLASEGSVDIDLGWQGFKSMFSGEGMLWLKASGTGQLVLSSFGAIYPIEVDGEYIVDTGHIVAFEESLDFSITKAGKSWLHSWLGGEGLVCKFKGRGTLWCQSHNASSFGAALSPSLRARKA